MTSRTLFLAVVAALAALALAVPVAGARPAADSAADQAAYSSDAGPGVSGRVIEIDDPGAGTSVRAIDDGFDWGAAGIGAGAFLVAFTALGLITLRPGARHGIRLH